MNTEKNNSINKSEQIQKKQSVKHNSGFSWSILFAGIGTGIILVVILLAAGNHQGWWRVAPNQYSRDMMGSHYIDNNSPDNFMGQEMMGDFGQAGFQNQAYWDNFDRQLIMMESDINQIRDYHNLMQNEIDEINNSGVGLDKLSVNTSNGNGEIIFNVDGKSWSINYKENNQKVTLDLSQLNKAIKVNPNMHFQIKILDANGKVLQMIDNKNVIKHDNLSLDKKDGKNLVFDMSIVNKDGSEFSTSQTI